MCVSFSNHFYSFTETKSDFSLILDVSLFKGTFVCYVNNIVIVINKYITQLPKLVTHI